MILSWKKKKNYPQVYLEECRYETKKKKTVEFIDIELDLDNSDDFNDSNYSNSKYLSAYWRTFLNLWTPNTSSR